MYMCNLRDMQCRRVMCNSTHSSSSSSSCGEQRRCFGIEPWNSKWNYFIQSFMLQSNFSADWSSESQVKYAIFQIDCNFPCGFEISQRDHANASLLTHLNVVPRWNSRKNPTNVDFFIRCNRQAYWLYQWNDV